MQIVHEDFIPNNIELRYSVSLALAKFKTKQAQALFNIMENSNHIFSKTAKELILLKYDMWFRWLTLVESAIKKGTYDNEHVKHEIRAKLVKMSDEIVEVYIDYLYKETSTFNKPFVDHWLHTHAFTYNYMKSAIFAIDTNKSADVFTAVVNILIDVMDMTMFEVFELDLLLEESKKDTETLYLAFDELCVDYNRLYKEGLLLNQSNLSECLITDRIKYYIDQGLIKTEDKITVRDFSYDTITKNKSIACKIEEAIKVTGVKEVSVIA